MRISIAAAVPTYFVLAFAISWAAILGVVGPAGIPGTGSDYVARGPLVFLAMLLGPSAAGLSLTAALGGWPGLRDLWACQRRWGVGRWWAAVLVTPVVLLLLGLLGLWSRDLSPGLLATWDRGSSIGFALGVGLAAGLVEELGWTGFALPRLQRQFGWFKAGLVLGLVWGLWHLLADYWGNADAWGAGYVPRYLLWCGASFTAYRVLIAWAYSHTRSLLLAQMMHAAFTGGQVLLGPALAPSATGLVWYAAFAAALWLAVGLVRAGERLGRPASAPSPAAACARG